MAQIFTGSSLTGMAIDPRGNYLPAPTAPKNDSSIHPGDTNEDGFHAGLPTGDHPAHQQPPGCRCVDTFGNIYIVDTAHSRIVKITSAGLASVFSISGVDEPPLHAELVSSLA